MAVHFPVQVQSFRFRQSLSLWERWHGVSRDGEGEAANRSAALPQEAGAAPAVFLHDPSRENSVWSGPQAATNAKYK